MMKRQNLNRSGIAATAVMFELTLPVTFTRLLRLWRCSIRETLSRSSGCQSGAGRTNLHLTAYSPFAGHVITLAVPRIPE